MRKLSRLLVMLAATVGVPLGAQAQSAGTVTGRVTERGTGAGIPSVTVSVVGTNRQVATDQQGRFRLEGVPAGQTEIRAGRVGYDQSTQRVAVVAGQTATVNFTLATSAVELGAIIVSATGREERRREIGASIGTVDVAEIPLAPITNAAQLLTGRVAGVTVIASGGTTGTGSRVRIRGSNSVSLSNEPLLIIDGVRVESGSSSNSLSVGGQSPSRLNDLNPEDIESIEVLKGPAAAAQYGTAAANGVIQVRTKRGVSGRTQFRAYSEFGIIEEPNQYPANFEATGTGRLGSFCITVYQAAGLCQLREITSFNPLEDPRTTPFRDGNRRQFGMNVSGGSEGTTFFLSGDIEDEQGVYEVSNLERVNLRANIRGQLRENLDMSVSTGYVNSDLQLPQNDNNILGIVSGGLLGSASFADTTVSPYVSGLFPRQLYFIDTRQDIDRFTGSTNLNWQPLEWLSFNGVAGLDNVARFDNETIPPNQVTFGSLPEGQRSSNRIRITNYTANGSGTATFEPREDLTSTTTVGVQYSRELFQGTFGFGARLLAGSTSLGATTARFSVDENTTEAITLGGLVRQQFAYNDRLFLTGSVRADQNSAFGVDFKTVFYPAVDVSFVALDRENLTLRPRVAFGQTGLRPNSTDALRFVSPVAVRSGGLSVPGFTLGGTGNRELKPEIVTEFEAGLDAGFFGNRLGVDLTFYNRESEDALIFRNLAPSLGVTTGRFENLGSVRNRGFEAQINAEVLDNPMAKFGFTLNATTTRNELLQLGEGIEPIIFGLGGDTQRHAEGYPLGGYWQRPIKSFDDTDGDGLLDASEVVVGDTAEYLGTPFPTRELQFTPRLGLFNDVVRVSALFDYRGGYKQFNSTREFRCTAFFNCEDAYNPDTPLRDQANLVASFNTGTAAGYIEDASFVKLRELSVTLQAPQRFARMVQAQGLGLTIAGRNLKTWTDYTGLDPEVNFIGQDNFRTADFLTQPPVRYVTARIDVNF